jgi:hypothetical protein
MSDEEALERWRASISGIYYSVGPDIYGSYIAEASRERFKRRDNNNYYLGNYFRTQEDAIAAAAAINEIFRKAREAGQVEQASETDRDA